MARLKPNEFPHGVRHHYAALKHHASDCIECGSCERKCPFGVKVIDNMREAVKLFGN
ncbi:MAG: 4Fe-4S dicluster domain-containing protein [Desulfovibrionaceae bacterium]|nr:4Fe-4S dicluster domain-containing protein [Desulfovibrionaceae bacterium]